jgi:hypothetical protein
MKELGEGSRIGAYSYSLHILRQDGVVIIEIEQ